MEYEQDSFTNKFGEPTKKFGWTAVPNITLQHPKELNLKPVEQSILLYIVSYHRKDFHAVSSICRALGLNDKTVRKALKNLETKRLIRKIRRTGEANRFDVSGWVSKNREYAILHQVSDQRLTYVSTQRISKDPTQELGTNKNKKEKEELGPGYRKFMERKNKRGYN